MIVATFATCWEEQGLYYGVFDNVRIMKMTELIGLLILIIM